MSAIVCGKRSFFDEQESLGSSPTSASPPAYKKFRCSSATSPLRLNYSPPFHPTPIEQLKSLFPDIEVQVFGVHGGKSFSLEKNSFIHEFVPFVEDHMMENMNSIFDGYDITDVSLLEKVLVGAGNDLGFAIKRLREHHLGKGESSSYYEGSANMEKGSAALPLKDIGIQKNLPVDGAEWVELFVAEMKSASNIDEARSRFAKVLESLEKSICAQAAENLYKENVMLKEQIELLFRDNAILKRAVAIQHERQKENDEKNQEVHQLKQLLAQYQEQLRTLEVNNYALTLHLRQAEQRNSIPGRFHPDVF